MTVYHVKGEKARKKSPKRKNKNVNFLDFPTNFTSCPKTDKINLIKHFYPIIIYINITINQS